MTKEEKELKEAVAKAVFDRRMQQLRSTMPPSESQLLKSVAAVPLSPTGASEVKEPGFPPVPSQSSGLDVVTAPAFGIEPQSACQGR